MLLLSWIKPDPGDLLSTLRYVQRNRKPGVDEMREGVGKVGEKEREREEEVVLAIYEPVLFFLNAFLY